jgi:DNA repair protein SbcC/Rad50
MIPVRLQISGFLSYQQPIDLDFSSFDLACISGQNGAGKSSLLDAITWVLFGEARRRDDAIINSHTRINNKGTRECRVVFEFQYEDQFYRVDRSKQPDKATVLEFQVKDPDGNWRPLTERAVRETETRIEHILRMDYDTFINASFFLQGKADLFAQQKPSERKRILSSILGLEIWETYRDQAAEKRKKLEIEQISYNGMLEEIENELKEEEARKAKLKALKETLDSQTALRQSKELTVDHLKRLAASLAEQKKLVDLFDQQRKNAVNQFEKRKTEFADRSLELEACRKQLSEADHIEAAYRLWQENSQELERLEKMASDFRQHESQRNGPLMAIETERARLEQERQTFLILAQQAEQIELQMPGLEAEIHKLKVTTTELSTSLEQAGEMRVALEAVMAAQSEAQAENKRLRQEMNELKERIDELNAASGASCPLCGQPLEANERQRLIESLEAQGRLMGDRYRQNQVLVSETNQRREEVETRTAAVPELEARLRSQQRLLDQAVDREKQIKNTLEAWRQNGAIRFEEVNHRLNENQFAMEARDDLAKIDTELKALGYDPTAHDILRLAEQEGRKSMEQLRQLENARAALMPLEREMSNLESQLRLAEQEAANQEKSYRDVFEKYKTDLASAPDMDQVQMDLLACREQENRIRMEVGAATQQVEVLKTQQIRKKTFIQKRESVQLQIGQVKTLERAFGKDGIPALLIEQALPEIESQANEILDRLSDGGMSVTFSTQKDYKDKNREDKKETLDILISDSAGKREYEMFSGGEAFRVNFAIRLALSRVLAQRAGARLRMLVIDEGFGSQDAEGRQRLIQAINMVQSDFSKILVITHLEELKDVFPARIEVEKTINGSTVKVIV